MITKPTLILDEAKCRKNIQSMFLKAERNKVTFRPHFKTHQSLEIGRRFKEFGVDKITVSSLSMAEYFSSEWNDITVAFPVNILEIDKINSLAERIKLNLVIESLESAEFLTTNLKFPCGIFVKLDAGYHRTGIDAEDFASIDNIIEFAGSSENLSFRGFLSHSGHSYKCRSKAEVLEIHATSEMFMVAIDKRYRSKYPDMIISVGDTPTCSVAEDFSKFDEIRPGNFVFYDLSQQQIGSCDFDQIAVALCCPVVAIHKERNEIVVYGGGVHFSKESMEDSVFGKSFGIVVENVDGGWGSPVPGMYVKTLSQEHGIISAPPNEISNYAIGDILFILPVHSCMTADVFRSYQTTTGRTIPRL